MTDEQLPEGGVLGIDPGSASGAISYVLSGSDAWAWPIKNMTEREVWDRVEVLAPIACLGVLERVNAMPKQGVASSFKFGASFGALHMALVACKLRYELVPPSVWQGKLNCRTGGDKKVSRDAAQRRFPGLKITNQTADALLIAEYGRLHLL
tara:strand:+ start:2709 stop:3164 length:456 start_codon:yes stop_codon:yes gene_type:complete